MMKVIIIMMITTIIMMMTMMDTTMIKTPLSSAVPDRSTLLQLNHAVCSRGEEAIKVSIMIEVFVKTFSF